jgi:hypothetical protein
MMTTITLFLLFGVGIWLYRQGKKADQIDELEDTLKKKEALHEMGQEHDAETDSILGELNRVDPDRDDNGSGSGPPSVLHKRR